MNVVLINLICLNYRLNRIILIYKIVELDLLKQHSFSDNFDYICRKVSYFLRYSCALTFCSKMKLKTLKKTFNKYGYYFKVNENQNYFNRIKLNYNYKVKI
jgi:hypothetical protein